MVLCCVCNWAAVVLLEFPYLSQSCLQSNCRRSTSREQEEPKGGEGPFKEFTWGNFAIFSHICWATNSSLFARMHVKGAYDTVDDVEFWNVTFTHSVVLLKWRSCKERIVPQISLFLNETIDYSFLFPYLHTFDGTSFAEQSSVIRAIGWHFLE